MGKIEPKTWTLPQDSECYRALVEMGLATGGAIVFAEPVVRQVEGADDPTAMLRAMLEQNITEEGGTSGDRERLLEDGDAIELPVRVFRLLAEAYQQIVGLNDIADGGETPDPKE